MVAKDLIMRKMGDNRESKTGAFSVGVPHFPTPKFFCPKISFHLRG